MMMKIPRSIQTTNRIFFKPLLGRRPQFHRIRRHSVASRSGLACPMRLLICQQPSARLSAAEAGVRSPLL
jgi:hypothetical protein